MKRPGPWVDLEYPGWRVMKVLNLCCSLQRLGIDGLDWKVVGNRVEGVYLQHLLKEAKMSLQYRIIRV